MAQQFIPTPGGNIYPDPDTDYSQSEAFRKVALNRDTRDTALAEDSTIKANTATANAIADATVKYGGLPGQLAALDAAAVKMRGAIPANTDLNTLRTSGHWYTGDLTNTQTLTNAPFQWPGIIHVISDPATFVTIQWAYRYGTSFAALWRISLTSTTWTPWMSMEWYKGNIPEGSNLDTLTPGSYRIPTTAAITTYTGTALPENKVGVFIVDGGTNSGPKFQEYITHGAGAKRYWRSSSSLAGAWNPWAELGAGGTPQVPAPTYGAGAPNLMRLQAFKDENPLVSTGNKGVVVFRYDHGLTNFKAHLWALHQAAGIPAYIAMNSRLWDITENNGATQAEAKAWKATGLVKFGNHTADHIDRNTAAGIYDTIVNGRKELETQLGGIIHGFTVPGLPEYNQFEGFGTGTLNSFSDTLAGSLILANHAISSGMVPSPGTAFRPLDGQIRQGGRHFTWESETFENIKAQIDEAAATKTALTLMCHPRTMGSTSGGKTYWTPALAAQVIDYVKSLIDAGQLANIDYYQSHHAQLAPLSVSEVDSDWRIISTTGRTGSTEESTLKIRRLGRTVICDLRGMTLTETHANSIASIPDGFKSPADRAMSFDANPTSVSSSPDTITLLGGSTMYYRPRSAIIATQLDGVIEWTTLDPVPATWPGTAG